ncbi:MAG: VOC family protein [Candidatus Paceibacterota bacterium]
MYRSRIYLSASIALSLACLAGSAAPAHAQQQGQAQQEFARTTIDLGCVVSDVDAAVKFYTQAIGFKELDGFDVPGDFATRAGLTDRQPLSIRVLVLGKNETATKLKLMQVPGSESKSSDNATIHSQLGFSYLTIYITDMDAAVARLEKAGVKIVGEGPVELPADLGAGIYLAVVRDPDGNLIELVGPKKQ